MPSNAVPAAPVPSELRGGLPPVIPASTRLLLLGSFPGVISLDQARYYAHPRNQFWRLVGACLDQPLHEMPYDDRLATLAAHGIGLWDMIAQCRRVGSLDAAVKDAALHPLADFLKVAAPRLQKIGFNGALSWKLGHPLAGHGYAVFKLPSSSPAAASVRFEDKLAIWREMFLS